MVHQLPRYSAHIIATMILVWMCFAPTGLIGLDETIYFAGADALRQTGTFVVENGASDFDHDALRLFVMVFGPEGLVPQYPVGSALAGAPMMALFGVRGMIIVNALAAVATLFVSRALALHLFKDEKVANFTPLLLASATFWPEFAFAFWPHSTSILCVSAGLLLALRAVESDGKSRDRNALLAGLVIGFGLLFRLDTLLLMPGLGAIALFYAAKPVRMMLLVGIGMVPALAISSFANQQKFGSWNPITYGKDGGFTAISTHVGPAIFIVVAGLALLAWRSMGFPRPSRQISAIAALVALAVALAVAPLRDLMLRYIDGVLGLIVDARTIEDARGGVAPLGNDLLLFWGHAKQALGQSAPWLGSLFLLLNPSLFAKQRRSIEQIALISFFWTLPLLLLVWHGGSGNNMRYLAPLLPLWSALGCWLIAEQYRKIERAYLPLGWGVLLGILALAAFVVLHPYGALAARQAYTPIILLLVCLACVAAALPGKNSKTIQAASLVAIGAGLSAAYFSTLTSLGQEQTERWVNERMSANFANLPDQSVVFGGIGLMRDYAFRRGHVLALPSEDPLIDDEALIEDALSKGWQVYTFPWIFDSNEAFANYRTAPTEYEWSDGVLLEVVENNEGCDAYVPHDGPLIAHAGGGLPDRIYANSREALDLAARHGFTLIELDFIRHEGELKIGHDEHRISDLTVEELFKWLDNHPGVRIVTDMKSGNQHLSLLAGRADRFIPQIYTPDEYASVRQLGYGDIIFTAYRMKDDSWQSAVNQLDLYAVTVPRGKRALAEGVQHPIFLHTVNEPMPGVGLYTDCLIPALARHDRQSEPAQDS